MLTRIIKTNKIKLIFFNFLILFNLNAGNKFTSAIKDIFDTASRVIIRKIVNKTDKNIKITNSNNETINLASNSSLSDCAFNFYLPLTNQEEGIDGAEYDLRLEFINSSWVCFLKFFELYGGDNNSIYLRKISKNKNHKKIIDIKPVCTNCAYDHIFTITIFIENEEPILGIDFSCLDEKTKKTWELYESQKNK